VISVRIPLSSAPVILICLADTLAWKSAPQRLKEMINSKKITPEEGFEALRRLRDCYSSAPEIAKRTALANAFVAVHQLLLSAAASDLASYLVTEFDEAKIKIHFHIPDSFLVAALVPVGHDEHAHEIAASDSPHPSYVYLEKFGQALVDQQP
jgi:nitroreductase